MKDTKDQGTGEMFGIKRGRGRPKSGNAKTGAERQAAHRAKKREISVTVTISRGLLDELDAQMQVIRDGGTAQVLSPEHAGEILDAIRNAAKNQLHSDA